MFEVVRPTVLFWDKSVKSLVATVRQIHEVGSQLFHFLAYLFDHAMFHPPGHVLVAADPKTETEVGPYQSPGFKKRIS